MIVHHHIIKMELVVNFVHHSVRHVQISHIVLLAMVKESYQVTTSVFALLVNILYLTQLFVLIANTVVNHALHH